MKRTLTKLIAIVTIVAFSATYSNSAHAQDATDILQHYWSGSSIISADFTKSGKAEIQHDMKLTHSGGNRFSGKITTTFSLDGVTYKCIANLSGTYDSGNHGFTFETGEKTRTDQLPYGLKWCDSWGTLYIYSNSEQSGYYLLKGDIKDSCGGTSDMELGDD